MIYDISLQIKEDMVVWKNKESKKPKFIITAKYDKDEMNESMIDMDLHTGTHIDSYYHMLKNGKKMDEIAIDKFIGKCRVLDLTMVKGKITKAELSRFNIKNGEIILFKTKNKLENKFDFNFTFLDKSGAEFLANRKIKTLGVDSLGLEIGSKDIHKVLFKNDIAVIEGLELSKIKQGEYFLIALPLKINADASPVRAVLVD